MQHPNFDAAELRVALARCNMTRVQLAGELGKPYSTTIGWLTGRYPAPPDFRAKVERLLGVKANALMPRPPKAT